MKNEHWYSKEKRRVAWRVYKYFVINEDLLNQTENIALFERAKEIVIDVYASEHKSAKRIDIENAFVMVANWENNAHPDDFKPDKETLILLEKSE